MNTRGYKLFVSDQCSCCDKVLDHLNRESIEVSIVNVDRDKHALPFNLVILPALVKEDKLIGYGGEDIMKYLNGIT